MKVSRPRPLWAAMFLVALVALASCSRVPTAPPSPSEATLTTMPDDPGGPAPSTPPIVDAPAIVPLVSSLRIDGRLGGVIVVGRWKLIVPAGAYAGAGMITLTIPDPSIDKCELEIFPASLNNFKEPVDLRYLCITRGEARTRNMQWWDPAAGAWKVIPSWPESSDNSRCAELKHFSTYKSSKAGW